MAAAEERLKWLQAVTDTSLANLSVGRLLDQLLVQVREFLDVDTAAVLLLDPSGKFLQATAAQGIEEEVHQGVRIPLGKGFAGRIAKERRWVSIEQVDHSNVLNPILRAKGIASLLGVPLIAAGSVLGVLHVGSLQPRRFTEADASLLQLVADRVATATQSRMTEAERAAATVMQRNLQPTVLPAVAGLEFAARYVTGGEGDVGGDWYDVFLLSSDAICVVVGDVVGHGLAAAQAMSQLRSVLRAFTQETVDPPTILSKLDHYVRRFQPGTLATVFCAVLPPSSNLVHISSAGHPPPILATPDDGATILSVPPDPPLGVGAAHRRSTVIAMPPDSVLCMYTDGLVERRNALIDDNIDLLRRTVAPQPAELVCVDVMSKLVASDNPDDDVAVLVVRRLPASERELTADAAQI